jgi:hypothetical protein
VLIRALPVDARVWRVQEADEVKSNKPTPEQIRARQEHYARVAEQRTN